MHCSTSFSEFARSTLGRGFPFVSRRGFEGLTQCVVRKISPVFRDSSFLCFLTSATEWGPCALEFDGLTHQLRPARKHRLESLPMLHFPSDSGSPPSKPGDSAMRLSTLTKSLLAKPSMPQDRSVSPCAAWLAGIHSGETFGWTTVNLCR